MYDIHLRLTGKRIVDFLLVLIEMFSLRVIAEALQAKIDRKLTICKWVGGSASTKFLHRRGRPPLIIFAWIVRAMNALQLCR